jgi:hypothetical protein
LAFSIFHGFVEDFIHADLLQAGFILKDTLQLPLLLEPSAQPRLHKRAELVDQIAIGPPEGALAVAGAGGRSAAGGPVRSAAGRTVCNPPGSGGGQGAVGAISGLQGSTL